MNNAKLREQASQVFNGRPFRVLSLGAGVQSSTVLLLMLLDKLPKADCAIFADTGWEPPEVYEHLARLETLAAQHGMFTESAR